MENLLTLAKRSETVEGSEALYELSGISVNGKERFLISVSYMQGDSLCALDTDKRDEAEKIFDIIISTKTTPLSLCDAVYDLVK